MSEAVSTHTGHAVHSPRRPPTDECDLMIVTEALPSIHCGGLLGDAIRRSFGDEAGTYDLVSVPSLKHLLKDGDACAMLALDVAETARRHRAQRVLVATVSVPPRQVIQRLKDRAEIRSARNIRFKGFTVQRPRAMRVDAYRTLVLTCADHRLQGQDGVSAFYDAAGRVAFGLSALPGAVRGLATDPILRRVVLAQLALVGGRGLKRVILASLDEGRGNGARAGLEADLAAAACVVGQAFPAIETVRAVARVDHRRFLGLDLLDAPSGDRSGR